MIKSIKNIFKHISSNDVQADDIHKIPSTSILAELILAVTRIVESDRLTTDLTVEERVSLSIVSRTSLQSTMTFLNMVESRICNTTAADKYIEEIPLWLTDSPYIVSNLDKYLVINNRFVEYNDVVECIIGSVLRIHKALAFPSNDKFVSYYTNKPATLYRELLVILETRLSHC